MSVKILEGKDETDVRKQLWDWRFANPNISITHEYPVEWLIPELRKISPGKKLEAQNAVSMRVDYTEL